MNSAAESTPTPAEAEVLRQLETMHEQIRESQRTLSGQAKGALTLDVGLDADLLSAFNAGASQTLILLVQIVRLLRQTQTPSDST